MKQLFTLSLVFLLATEARLSAQSNIQTVDSLFKALYNNYEVAGNLLVAEKGRVILKDYGGSADVQQKKPLTDQTTFQLASLSKTFTAIAILQLKEKGKLRLEDPVQKYLPTFKYPNISLRHLLNHTSGLVDFQMFEAAYEADTTRVFKNEDILTVINQGQGELRFQPGEKWSYSNPGYCLLALVVEKMSGLTFQEYLRKNIFQPAGMTHTYIAIGSKSDNDTNRAIGYDFPAYAPWIKQRNDLLQQNRIELHNLGDFVGHSNIISTTGDLLLYDRALYNNKLLKAATLEEALTPAKLNNGELAATGWDNAVCYYGLGWMILKDTTYGKVVFHPGGMTGAVTILLRNVTKDQTLILLNNETHRENASNAVSLLRALNGLTPRLNKKSLAKLYVRTLILSNPDSALVAFNSKKSDTASYYLDEREMNVMGLQMFYNEFQQQGLKVLALNTILFPNSANVYDSYAGALKHLGKRQEAMAMFGKSLTLNPKNTNAQKQLSELGGK
ncbi:CubicO group peptidase (beta-lactamase class C family) [Chitinophaga skermanii]|uniref:CubicO group peptidase (Beta-lactamase class C family) n=1 Tax=Chitinophaga skermanii TaxID=331697 RepID=A0A327QWC8_9BACT|nr:serine hydrolase domain-containing protein [Chitinophaga skermanii]RAJ08641.1 CubicO group peptidase (beta-lactamase class C family) [Chitinophaga skermanii]